MYPIYSLYCASIQSFTQSILFLTWNQSRLGLLSPSYAAAFPIFFFQVCYLFYRQRHLTFHCAAGRAFRFFSLLVIAQCLDRVESTDSVGFCSRTRGLGLVLSWWPVLLVCAIGSVMGFDRDQIFSWLGVWSSCCTSYWISFRFHQSHYAHHAEVECFTCQVKVLSQELLICGLFQSTV
jgi:hypothetical protein